MKLVFMSCDKSKKKMKIEKFHKLTNLVMNLYEMKLGYKARQETTVKDRFLNSDPHFGENYCFLVGQLVEADLNSF